MPGHLDLLLLLGFKIIVVVPLCDYVFAVCRLSGTNENFCLLPHFYSRYYTAEKHEIA